MKIIKIASNSMVITIFINSTLYLLQPKAKRTQQTLSSDDKKLIKNKMLKDNLAG